MSVEQLNLRHLRVFLEVLDSKSISKASVKVFLSQSAITQAIAKLEIELSTSLFHRQAEGMLPTESGLIFAFRVRRALSMILSGLQGVSRISDGQLVKPSKLIQAITSTQLRNLITITQSQNFSIASRALKVSQSSLHRAARGLESRLGTILFEKTTNGITSSKAALRLARAAKLAFNEITQARQEINAFHNRELGKITIGSMPLARASILPITIIEFNKRFPNFKISVVDGIYDDLLSHLRNGDIDLLTGALRLPNSNDDIKQEDLFASSIEVLARADHPLVTDCEVSLKKLSVYPWVVLRRETPTRALFDTVFSSDGVEMPERIIESGSQGLIRSLLLGDDWLTMSSEHQFQYELDSGLLKKINFEHRQTPRRIGITTRKSWNPTGTQLAFVNLLREKALLLNE
ncbi:MAG: LysR family transcriptional regulator [Gammaproteobacteria bacterium]|jgi:LysR family transcriptional regulator, regulator for genes of the gallate degradation pathway|nr:LysR family transcriptional regulator [Gammaproteobacteria bacterium]